VFWTPEAEWYDETAYIIGGGPSVNDTDLTLLHDRRVIGVNNAYRLGPWVDIGWFGDRKWIQWHAKEFEQFPGIKASCNANPTVLANKSYGFIKFIHRGKILGIDKRPGFVAWNKCSGNSAINLAYHLGSRRIVLVGFDMKSNEKGETNYHNDHAGKNSAPYNKFLAALEIISKDAEKLDVEILNACPGSACKYFPKGELSDFI